MKTLTAKINIKNDDPRAAQNSFLFNAGKSYFSIDEWEEGLIVIDNYNNRHFLTADYILHNFILN